VRLGALRLGRLVDQHETILIAVRGNIPPALPLWPSVMMAPVGRHSEKPRLLMEWIDRDYGPALVRIEMFAPAVRSPRLAVLGRRGAGRAHVRLLACYSVSMTPIKAAAVIARGSSGRVMLMQRADGVAGRRAEGRRDPAEQDARANSSKRPRTDWATLAACLCAASRTSTGKQNLSP
jgi:hypothetical protein